MRFGLLGTGPWAAETQVVALAAHERVELVGVWGRNAAKAEALAARHGARGYADVDALIADVDAVAVALPPDIQADLALRAARAGRHLVLDKPLALDVAAADRLVGAVDEHDLASLVFTTRRFTPSVVTFIDETVRAGGWYGATAIHHSSIFQPDNPYGASPWRREHGGLWDVGPHALSVVTPVLGPVTAVTAVMGPQHTAYLTLTHASGAVSSLALTVHAEPAAMLHTLAFYGPAGVAVLPEADVDARQALTLLLDELLRLAAAPDKRHPCDARAGRDTVAVLAAAEVAAREGRTVEL